MTNIRMYLLGIACILAFVALMVYVYIQYKDSQVEDIIVDTTKKGPIALQVFKDGKLVGEYRSIAEAIRDKTLDIPSASIRSSSYMRDRIGNALKKKCMYAGYTWVKK